MFLFLATSLLYMSPLYLVDARKIATLLGKSYTSCCSYELKHFCDVLCCTSFSAQCLGILILNEPRHDKTNNMGVQSGPTQTRLYNHRK